MDVMGFARFLDCLFEMFEVLDGFWEDVIWEAPDVDLWGDCFLLEGEIFDVVCGADELEIG